ncbi:MAG: UDP-N-acetylmuramoyl-tripeptide--D-alanyl-D-alanine ligase, partial [Eubacteriaceae bacterium]|nr:UDP-N-acetylmuramoyl-tripeptide--D-alanyl-D-alanine ligase [Eubacteriaceae bacterium]
MKSLTLDRIARMCRGRIVSGRGDETFDSVCIDSRQARSGSVFFALKGEVTDGHLYIGKAVESGAGCVITDHETECFGACQIVTEDTFTALQDMAAAYRDDFEIPFVGVTGSSGKTTNKDLIASVLSQKYDTLKTFGNLNSTTGVPLTLFELEDHHQIAVIEMSMSARGEILGNAAIVRPETAVITNVGTAHIEFLGSRENIFRAKSEIF